MRSHSTLTEAEEEGGGLRSVGGGGGGGTVGRFSHTWALGKGDECVSAWKGERGNSPLLVAVKGGRKRREAGSPSCGGRRGIQQGIS